MRAEVTSSLGEGDELPTSQQEHSHRRRQRPQAHAEPPQDLEGEDSEEALEPQRAPLGRKASRRSTSRSAKVIALPPGTEKSDGEAQSDRGRRRGWGQAEEDVEIDYL